MALVGRGHRPPPEHLDDDGVADHPHVETRKGGQDDGYHRLQMQLTQTNSSQTSTLASQIIQKLQAV